MAVVVSFINDGQAHDADEFADYFADFVSSGVYAEPNDGLQVSIEGYNAVIAAGTAFIQGVRIHNEASLILGIANPTTGATRCDMVIVRLDKTQPKGEIVIKQGTLGTGEYPTLTRTNDVYELCLAKYQITGGAGATLLTDTRFDSELCGIVGNILFTPDSAAMRQEFQTFMDEQEAYAQNSFQAIQDQADELISSITDNVSSMFGADGRQGFMNPSFRVNQRGKASYSLTSGNVYTFDRWMLRIGTLEANAPVVVSREFTGGKNALTIQNYVYKSGGIGASAIVQTIEGGVRTFCAGYKQFTVSFDAKATNPQRIAVEPMQFASEVSDGVTIQAQIANVGTEWQRFSFTFTGSLDPAATDEDALKIGFYFAWAGYQSRFGDVQNAENKIYLANMQINEGGTALLPYIPPVWADVQACRRYYRNSSTCQLTVGGQTTTARQVRTQELQFDDMRKAPLFSFTDRAGAYNKASLYQVSGTYLDGLDAVVSTYRAKGVTLVITNTGVTAASAILGSWEANAEYYI